MNQTEKSFATASAGPRLFAALIDYVIHGITIGILVAIVWGYTGYENAFESIMDYTLEGIVTDTYIAYSLMSVASAIVSGFIYYGVIPTKTKGQTLGKKMFHIKAIKNDGTPPGMGTNLLRAVMLYGAYFSALFSLAMIFDDYSTYEALNTPSSYITSLIVFIALIMILTRNDKRGLHDLLAKTQVIFEGSNLGDESDTASPRKEDPFEFDYDTLDDE